MISSSLRRSCKNFAVAAAIVWPLPLGARPQNLVPAGVVTGSSNYLGSPPSTFAKANDDNRDGNYYSGLSVWHSAVPETNPPTFYEVDLGATFHLDRLMLWPRTDVAQGTVTNFRVLVYSASGAVVWQQDFLPGSAANNAWGTSALRGVQGRRVRLQRLNQTPNFVTFAEFEVWGSTSPGAENLARNRTVTSSGGGAFSTATTAGNDGDLGGDYTLAGRPVFHSTANAVGQFWQVDLGAPQPVDTIVIYTRTDFASTSGVKLSLRDSANAEVYAGTLNISRDVLVRGGRQFDVTHDVPTSVDARYVRIETLNNEYLVFGEVEVFPPPIDLEPPTVAATDPPAGTLLAELFQTEVEFTEEVTGVEAADLLVNGVPATTLTPLGTKRFAFGFARPPDGLVVFSWAGAHGIADRAGHGFAFSNWTVTLDTTLPAARPFISEFLASNEGGLEDADGDSPDWIEITNPGPTSVNLAGWFLTDDLADRMKWRFPGPTLLAAGSRLIVFASSKNLSEPGAELHTNFKLDPDGDSIALVKPDGVTVASGFASFPPQRKNVSFGVGQSFTTTPLVADGATVRLLVPASAVPDWEKQNFDDSSWPAAVTGVGFDISNGSGAGGPLGYWDFNNPANTSAALDSSGYARNGTITNATYSAAGGGHSGHAGDRALNFAGNGSVHIPAAGTGAFDLIADRDAVTLSVWVFGAPVQPSGDFLFHAGSNPDGSGSRVLAAHVPWSDSVIYWDTADCCDPGLHRIFIGEPNPARWRGQWNHYAFVKDGSRKEIWQNGQLLHAGENTAPMGAFRSLRLGALNASGTNGYHGAMDDFAIWDGALSASQIGSLAAGGSPLTVRLLQPLIRTDIAAAMHNQNATAYLRASFNVADPTSLDILKLRTRYDDGFIAMLNGVEVARRHAPGPATWNSTASSERPGGAAFEADEIDVSSFTALLRAGVNVLALQGLNHSAGDSDFLMLPELFAGSSLPDRYFTSPTPGTANDAGSSGFVGDTHFSPRRGFYDTPVTVTISCDTPGAMIAYTRDGSEPSSTIGTQAASPATVTITATTPLRALAHVPGSDLASSNVDTHTYLFVDRVASQQRPTSVPATYPGGAPADFAMDARVPGLNPPTGYSLRDALLSIPTLALSLPGGDLWGPSGIYVNTNGRGDGYEREASAEWLVPSSSEEFHAGCGLRIHGNISRDKAFTPKHGFKLFFRSEYGDSKLRHPLFNGSPVETFDELILRGGSTDTWPCVEWGAVGLGPNGEAYQRWARPWSSYVRDQWSRDAMIAMGQPACNGRFCHLYLNGLYWGLYNLTEHPDAAFMADHLGGRKSEWDALADFSELQDGTTEAWNQLIAAASAGLSTNAAVQKVLGNNPDGTRNTAFPVLLNLDSLIDYMILHIYIGADDWPNHNWWAGRRSRSPLTDGFHFFPWDQEISNENVLYARSSWGPLYQEANAPNTPTQLYAALRANAEYRVKFGDRVQRHLFNGGALSQQKNLDRWHTLTSQIDRAVIAESARWGDYQPNNTNPGQPYTRGNAWLPHLQWMEQNYWPQIPATALQRFRAASLFPALNAPQFSQFGGDFPPGFQLTITNPTASSAVLFTLDGSDPRAPGGANAASAQTYASAISLSGTTTVKARVKQGTSWSALVEAAFRPDPDLDSDGLPNDWESAHGLDPNDVTDAGLDFDHDGRSNGSEYAAGTDPRDGSSLFAATSQIISNGMVRFIFTQQPGRSYRVERTASLPATSWSVRASYEPEASAREVTFSESPSALKWFYRVVVEAPVP